MDQISGEMVLSTRIKAAVDVFVVVHLRVCDKA